MEFIKERKEGMLFPQPRNGDVVLVSPPGFTWLPAEGAKSYRIIIKKTDGVIFYEKEVGNDPIHLPNIIFDVGSYVWDVTATDKCNNIARRGEQHFSISKDATRFPWINPKDLLIQVSNHHPRLIYSDKNLPTIRKTTGTTRKKSWLKCKVLADKALESTYPKYPRYQDISDLILRRLEYKKYYRELAKQLDEALINLSIAYLVSEDEKYSQIGKKILLEIVSWPTDDNDVTSVSSIFGDEPGLHISKCIHRAYDWLYDSLDENERKKVLNVCEARAWQIYRRLKNDQNFLTYPGESHAGRLIVYLAEMAIVMASESDGAEEWLNYSLKALTTFYPHWGGLDGGWAEGMDYAKDYNSFYIPLFESLRITCNYNLWQKPFFKNLRFFFLYCSSPFGEIQPFGDGADRSGPGINGQPYTNLMAYYAHIFQDSDIGWWAKQVPFFEGLTNECLLIFEDNLPIIKPITLSNSRLFPDVGWAGLHSNLGDPNNDTFMLFKSSSYGSVSHSHADQNSFAIMKGGNALSIPSGYYGPLYGSQHHDKWTRSTKANNCILVNGEGQTTRSSKANGKIIEFEDSTGFTYLVGEATNAYEERLSLYDRHILFIRPGIFLMLDDLSAQKESKYQWMMHSLEQMIITENKQITSSRKGSILNVHLFCPQGLKLTQTDEFDTPYNSGIPKQFNNNLPNHWHVTAETTVEAKSTRIGAVMIVSDSKELFETHILIQNGWYGARVKESFGEVEGWVQTIPNTNGPSGFDDSVLNGRAIICGRDVDGKIFSR